jgi:hypothetical protein
MNPLKLDQFLLSSLLDTGDKLEYQCTLMPVAHILTEKHSNYFLQLPKVVGEPSPETHAT